MTELHKYLSTPGAQTAKALAAAVGVSAPYITDLRHGRRFASADVAQKIADATSGAVSPESLLRAERGAA